MYFRGHVNCHCQSTNTYPECRSCYEPGPEDVDLSGGQLLGRGRVLIRGSRLKHPLGLSVVVNVVPPPEADHEPTCDVLHRPEIKRKQQNDADKAANEAVWVPPAQKVNWNYPCSEKIFSTLNTVPIRARLLKIRWKKVMTGCFSLRVVLSLKFSKLVLSMKGPEGLFIFLPSCLSL